METYVLMLGNIEKRSSLLKMTVGIEKRIFKNFSKLMFHHGTAGEKEVVWVYPPARYNSKTAAYLGAKAEKELSLFSDTCSTSTFCLLMIVYDRRSIRIDRLIPNYKIFNAENGKEALDIIKCFPALLSQIIKCL